MEPFSPPNGLLEVVSGTPATVLRIHREHHSRPYQSSDICPYEDPSLRVVDEDDGFDDTERHIH